VFENSDLVRGPADTGIINERFFAGNFPALNMEKISKLKITDLFRDGNFLSLDEISANLEIDFSLATYLRLSGSVLGYKYRQERRADDQTSVPLSRFWSKKGGEAKKIRKILDISLNNKKQLRTSTVFNTYIRLTGIDRTFRFAEKVYGFWANGFLCNKIRDFCYKYVNNQLSLNTRRSHYVANVNRSCSFCVITGTANPPDETFSHLFLDCPVTARIHNWFLSRYLNIVPVDRIRRAIFWSGEFDGINEFSSFGFTMAITIQWLIWDMKLQKRVLQPLTLDENFIFIMANCLRISPKLRHSKGNFRLLTHTPARWRN
jgi:hypothetical protein